MIAVIIPAKDEETRIANVLAVVVKSKLAHEIIVVSDGSTDRTAEVARRFTGVRVVELKKNIGKGAAMAKGVESTKADIVAFVDADLIGLKTEHVDQIIRPLVNRECEMCVGIFRGGKVVSNTAQSFFPYLSGQRALTRRLFQSVPLTEDCGMGIEVLLTRAAKRQKARVLRVVLRGVSNSHKEVKLGLVKGVKARKQMYGDIWRAMTGAAPKKPKPPRNDRKKGKWDRWL